MKRFTDVWLIGGTAGNPGGSLMTVVLYIYRNAFLSSQMGLATAVSYLLFVIILILTVFLIFAQPPQRQFGLTPLSMIRVRRGTIFQKTGG